MKILSGQTAISVAIIGLGLGVVGPGFDPAQAGAQAHTCPSQNIGDMGPCLTVWEDGNKTIAQWDNDFFFTRFVLTWQRDGGPLHQVPAGRDTRRVSITDTWRSTNYHFAVQGCDTWLAMAQQPCSAFTEVDYTTQATYPAPCNLCGDTVGHGVRE